MKQDAFIQRLRQGLTPLSKQEVEEIVADYREYIGDAIAAGRNEEEVIAALGDPVKLAREIKAQATYRRWQARRSFGNLARVVASVAGLGLLNLLLLLPFLLYLLLLTAGYMVSSGFAIAGLVTVVGLSSHALFGWPHPKMSSVHVSAQANHAASDAANAENDSTDQAPDLGNIKEDGDHFVLDLDEGSKASIVTRDGLVVMKNEDGKTKVVAIGTDADKLLEHTGEDTYRIAIADVTSLKIESDDGGSVSVKHASGNKATLVWDVRDEDGSDTKRVQIEQNAQGDASRIAVEGGTDSVVIDASKGISVNDGDHNVHIVAPLGASLTGITFGAGLAMLIGGLCGVLVCFWLTRATWRGLSRYVHRQIDAISARLGEHGQAS